MPRPGREQYRSSAQTLGRLSRNAMTRQRNSTDRGADDRYRRDQILYEWQLNSLARFRLFFAGLVFAVLAFSIQFSVEAPETVVRWLQILG